MRKIFTSLEESRAPFAESRLHPIPIICKREKVEEVTIFEIFFHSVEPIIKKGISLGLRHLPRNIFYRFHLKAASRKGRISK